MLIPPPLRLIFALLAASTLAVAQAPDPDSTLPPPSAHLRLTAVGIGVQVYACTLKDNAFSWVFQEPQADLFDPATRQPVGTHTAGPTWTWSDGSAVTGTVLVQHPAPDPANNVPWLLLSAHPNPTAGALHAIAFVRRSETGGGMPTTSVCDLEHANNTAKVPYRATYTFYSAD